MTCRVSLDTRQALEAEAERSGRTIGQVAELWLEQARALHALGMGTPVSIREGSRKRKAAKDALDALQMRFEGF